MRRIYDMCILKNKMCWNTHLRLHASCAVLFALRAARLCAASAVNCVTLGVARPLVPPMLTDLLDVEAQHLNVIRLLLHDALELTHPHFERDSGPIR